MSSWGGTWGIRVRERPYPEQEAEKSDTEHSVDLSLSALLFTLLYAFQHWSDLEIGLIQPQLLSFLLSVPYFQRCLEGHKLRCLRQVLRF